MLKDNSFLQAINFYAQRKLAILAKQKNKEMSGEKSFVAQSADKSFVAPEADKSFVAPETSEFKEPLPINQTVASEPMLSEI